MTEVGGTGRGESHIATEGQDEVLPALSGQEGSLAWPGFVLACTSVFSMVMNISTFRSIREGFCRSNLLLVRETIQKY